MFKHTLTYETFDDETVTDELFFHFTEPELTSLFNTEGYIPELEAELEEKKMGVLFDRFQGLLLDAYGIKSEDGRQFRKSPEIREDFRQSAAYAALFNEFNAKPELLLEFFRGMFPRGFKNLVDQAVADTEKELETVNVFETEAEKPGNWGGAT